MGWFRCIGCGWQPTYHFEIDMEYDYPLSAFNSKVIEIGLQCDECIERAIPSLFDDINKVTDDY